MPAPDAAFLALVANLSEYHREHEKHYGSAPLADALDLLRAADTLKALAERWTHAEPAPAQPAMPYAGAPDLNDPRAIELAGVLFLESGEVPPEITRLRAGLRAQAESADGTGRWLEEAMEAAWAVAAHLPDVPGLADLVAERHAIVAADWRSASTLQLVARLLARADEVLERVDFTAAGVRADLAGARRSPALLFSAAELIDQATALSIESTALVRGNERRWRVFHDRVEALRAA
jgi:hypothetical protein